MLVGIDLSLADRAPHAGLFHGDCVEVMRWMASDGLTVDAVVTDPPYNLGPSRERGFMGKRWDNDIAARPETWHAAMGVLKPGGHLLVFGGTRTFHRVACAMEDAGLEIRDCVMWLYGSGLPKCGDIGKAMLKHHPEEAAAWEGWSAALKPAWEPIILARKPIRGTVIENILRFGTGALNVDRCRVPTDDYVANRSRSAEAAKSKGIFGNSKVSQRHQTPGQQYGRWPANVIHDGSEEVTDLFPFSPGQIARAKTDHVRVGKNVYGPKRRYTNNPEPRGDKGSAARFFYSAKAGKAERAGSKHPTIKPVALMRYLVRLVVPPGGTVLDPFAGSGTTLQAANEEEVNSIGIEKETGYIQDIISRFRNEGQVK